MMLLVENINKNNININLLMKNINPREVVGTQCMNSSKRSGGECTDENITPIFFYFFLTALD